MNSGINEYCSQTKIRLRVEKQFLWLATCGDQRPSSPVASSDLSLVHLWTV